MAIDIFRPRGGVRPAPQTPEVRSELDQFVERLRQVGASPDEIAATIANWDVFDDDFGPEQRRDMVRWSDPRLRAEILALRQEYAEHTTS